AFWYQLGVPKTFAALPTYAERRVPWETHHLVQVFQQAKTTGPVKVRVDTSGMFGARPVLSWTNSQVGARLSLPFNVQTSGRQAVRLNAALDPAFGVYDIELDGHQALSAVSFRGDSEQELDLSLGTLELESGPHTISFVALDTGGGVA